jgi:hypothetical protein
VGPTTRQHVPQKQTKPYLCQNSTMSVHISLTRVSQNCGPFCLLCLDLQTEIYVLLTDHVAVSECSWCGPYSADSLGLCSLELGGALRELANIRELLHPMQHRMLHWSRPRYFRTPSFLIFRRLRNTAKSDH